MLDLVPAFFFDAFMGKPVWMWAGFLGLVLFLLALDLGIFHRKAHVVELRESLMMTGFYIAIALTFGIFIWQTQGSAAGAAFYTGFFIEKSLSLDNIFVISLIFGYLAIPRENQHRVLFWGILGVIVLRGIMILAGAALVSEFAWVLYLFAAFLIFTGIKMLVIKEGPPDIGKNPLLLFLQKRLRVTPELDGQKFIIRRPTGKGGATQLWVTPLFVALLLVETADVIFAVDSVPAIFAITTDPYIIYTSNIFAILGLRALYFALAAILHRFHHLKTAMALVLVFIGSKVFVAWALDLEKVPAMVSLFATLGLLAGGVIASLVWPKKNGTAV